MAEAGPGYDNSFSKAERKEILASPGKAPAYETTLSAYSGGHGLKALADLPEKGNSLTATLTLVTHNSRFSCQEIRQLGGVSEEQAKKMATPPSRGVAFPIWQGRSRTFFVLIGFTQPLDLNLAPCCGSTQAVPV